MPPAFPATIAGTTPTLRDNSVAEAQTRLQAPSGATTPTTSVFRAFHRNNSLPPPLTDPFRQPSPFQAPRPSPPLLRTLQTCTSDPRNTVATRTRVHRTLSAPTGLSMADTRSRLHQRCHTRAYQVPPTMLACIMFPQSLTPFTHPTLFNPPTPPRPIFNVITRPRVGALVPAVGLRCGREGAGTPSPSSTLLSA